jgi:hypothetical protein
MASLTLLVVPWTHGEYLLVKDVLSTSGGHLESASYLLDYSTGQVAVGQSQGTDHIESGGFWAWEPWGFEVSVEQEVTALLPETYMLAQNYPNPFNPKTTIRYQLPQSCPVSLTIYNVLGQAVCRLVDWEQAPGSYLVIWNGVDDLGRPVASGIYFYQLTAGEFRQVRKMLMLK